MGLSGMNVCLRLWDLVFALCWRGARFKLALRLSKAILPLARMAGLYEPNLIRQPDLLALDGHRGFLLALAFDRMARCGLTHDLKLTVRGGEVIREGGAIILGGHFRLNYLFLRWLHDQGWKLSAVMAFHPDPPKISGTNKRLDVIPPDAWCLHRVRRHIAEGRKVGVEVDSVVGSPGRRWIELPDGKVFISDSIFRLAERARIPIYFIAARVTPDDEIVVEVVQPTGSDADATYDEFCRFLQDSLELVHGARYELHAGAPAPPQMASVTLKTKAAGKSAR